MGIDLSLGIVVCGVRARMMEVLIYLKVVRALGCSKFSSIFQLEHIANTLFSTLKPSMARSEQALTSPVIERNCR